MKAPKIAKITKPTTKIKPITKAALNTASQAPEMRIEDLRSALRGSLNNPRNGHVLIACIVFLGAMFLAYQEERSIKQEQDAAKQNPQTVILAPDTFGNKQTAVRDILAADEKKRQEEKLAAEKRLAFSLAPVLPGQVRVAAVQYCSVFGRPAVNRKNLAVMIRRAAGKKIGAKIIVLPEAAIPGYADITNDTFWNKDPKIEDKQKAELDTVNLDAVAGQRIYRFVGTVAETIKGASYQFFSPLCKELQIYLTVPIIEKSGGDYFNTVFLLAPDGKMIIHYRKQKLWDPGDVHWATKGDLGTPIADTRYGRVAVIISYDMHEILPTLHGKNVDFVLHSSAFFGMNFEGVLRSKKFLRLVKLSGANLILANWSYPWKPWWEGWGMSRVLSRDTKKRWRVKNDLGNSVVIADLPTGKTWAAEQAKARKNETNRDLPTTK